MDVEGCSAELAALAQRQKLKEREQAEEEAKKIEEQRKLAEEEQGACEVPSDEKVQVVPAEVENGEAVHDKEEQSAGAEAPLPPSASAEDPAEVPVVAVEEQEAQEPTSYAAAAAPPPASPSLGTLSKLSAEAPAFSPQQPFVAPPPAPTEEPKESAPSESTVLSRSWAQVVATGEDQAEEVGSQVSLGH